MRLTTLLLAVLISVGIVGTNYTYASQSPSGKADVQLVKKGKKKHHAKKKHKRNHKKKVSAKA